MGSIRAPRETQAPLIVDADAVLPLSATFERFQAISGWYVQARKFRRGVELQQLSASDPFDGPESAHIAAMEQRLRIDAGERMNHQTSCSSLRNLSSRSDSNDTQWPAPSGPPLSEGSWIRKLGALKNKLRVPDDFDAPLPAKVLASFEIC